MPPDLAMRLLEREAQLRDLHAALELARQGRGTTVLLSGEAGIGKTSLLRAFAAQVAPNARVLVGTCEDLLTPRPLGPFRDMARDAGGALAGLGDNRDAFIDALLEAMAFSRRPAVLIVEDAHWADDASLDVVRYLARRMERLAAMLVVSYRDEELDSTHPFRRLVGALAGPAVLRLELEGLSDGAVAELASEAGLDPAPVVAAVGGNPFHLSEVLAAPGTAVPPSVRQAVLVRFASLPAGCRAALEQLAVIPAEAEDWLVAALLEDRGALEPAERRGMLVGAQGRLRFRHELARRAIELSLSPSRRIGLHRRVLAALIAAGAEPSRLVHHAMGAADEPAVARYAAAAAGQALLISARMDTLVADPASARAKALRALRILAPLGPSRALALCYSTLGSQDTLQGRFEAAAGWSTRAVELARQLGGGEVISHALGYRGVAKVSLGDQSGFADLREAIETAARLGHGDYLTVAAHNLAVVLIRSGCALEAEPYLAIGERAAREHGLDTALFRIEAQQCHVLLLRGEWDQAERRLRELLAPGRRPRREPGEPDGVPRHDPRPAGRPGGREPDRRRLEARLGHRRGAEDGDRRRGAHRMDLAGGRRRGGARARPGAAADRHPSAPRAAPRRGAALPAPRRRGRGAVPRLPARAGGGHRRRPGPRGGPLGAGGQSLRAGAGADRVQRPGGRPGGPADAGRARRGRHRQPGARPPAAPGRARRPAGSACGHQGEPGQADRPSARRACAAGRGAHQCRDRRAPVRLPPDGRQPRRRAARPAGGQLTA
jgi:hypothetical protein